MILRAPILCFFKTAIVVLLIWILAENSISAQHLDHRRYTNDDRLSQSGLISVIQDSKGFLWVGTKSGVSKFDGHQFVMRFDSLGVLKSGVRCIEEFRSGSVFASSVSGYVIFEPNGRIVAYEYPAFDSTSTILSWTHNGKVYVLFEHYPEITVMEATLNGPVNVTGSFEKLIKALTQFDITNFSAEILIPKVCLTQVYTYNDRLDWNPLPISDFGKGEVKLSHLDNNIRFEFRGICGTSPDGIKFSYILEGFDKYWSKPGTDRNVSYTNLPAGNYTFKVKACNDSGVWSETNAEFKVKAIAAHWQRWYFYLLVVILVSALVIVGVSHFMTRRTRIIREHLDGERRFAELQFKTLRNQLAPHFIFNALNAIGSSIYQNDKEISYDFLQQFATLIRSTLIHADKTYRTLNEEIEFVKNYLDLEKFRFENKFDYKIVIENGINPDILVPKMIIQTFAENAVKHGLVQKSGKGFLSIQLNLETDYLKIIIEDNGIGRVESLKYNTGSIGEGMEIIREFIALFNRFNEKKIHFDVHDISDDKGKIAGTSVIIKLPIDFTYNSITTKP